MTTPEAKQSLVTRTLWRTALRIAFVSVLGGAVSYVVNQSTLEQSVRKQLVSSTQQKLQRESLEFREIKRLQANFLREFRDSYAVAAERDKLANTFDLIFYRHDDGSYTQRPGLFEGQALADGRRFPGMSATYAPETPPNADVKARFVLSYLLSYKYGSATKGRLFNFYGVVPEKGFPIHQESDIAKVFTYSGPDALKLETYEFYSRGFGSRRSDTIYTRMYWDVSNSAWMTTVATADEADTLGNHKILACVDVLLSELMQRTAEPLIPGSRSTIFQADADGTLIFDSLHTEAIKLSEGKASIRSLKLEADYALLEPVASSARPGQVHLLETPDEFVAVGIIPDTPWAMAVRYPKSILRPAILLNLEIVVALGLVMLIVELLIIRSVLLQHVAAPLVRLIAAMRLMGRTEQRIDAGILPTLAQDEIGEVAREFATMADRVHEAQTQLEDKVRQRTAALEEANNQLQALSTTDALTGVANRRRFDEMLSAEWRRAMRTGSSLALAMIDVDWFKPYNDHYGHAGGDDCLRAVATALARNVGRPGDLLARYGGEEFAVIIPSSNAGGALQFAQKLGGAIEAMKLEHALSPLKHVSVSVGVASLTPLIGQDPVLLVGEADQALYRAKALGRNRAVLAGMVVKDCI